MIRAGDVVDPDQASWSMRGHQAVHPLGVMCHIMCHMLGVSASRHYVREEREPSANEHANTKSLERIKTLHVRSRRTYDVQRMMVELTAAGEVIGHNHSARLIGGARLVGASQCKGGSTTQCDKDERPAPDLVERKFEAEAPNRAWVA